MPRTGRTETGERATEDSTVEQVLEFIRDGIVRGGYPPRSKLLPKQIAESCGTSFIPVREALRVLESEGFVTFVHNRGAWVTPLSLHDLEDLYTIRLELECEAVRRASRFDDAEIEALEKMLERSRVSDEKGRRAEVVRLNRDFHFTIYRKADSPRRMKLIEQLWLHSARYQRMSLDYRHDAADAEHRGIVDMLRCGDHDAAAESLRTHLTSTVVLLKQGCRDLAPDGADDSTLVKV
ncbi:MAG TPA: GntR family transcriptional regulator [Ilumatobacteraceae bacterium]|nr:GntR family transcriptional regulator [Ilumatobacteraceae bacterium]